MGDFIPDAQVNGFDGDSFIAFICNKSLATIFAISFVFIMAQKYKVFFNRNKLLLAKTHFPDREFHATFENPDKLKIKEIISSLLDETKAVNYLIVSSELKKTWAEFCSFFEIRKAAGGLVINNKNEKLFIKRRGYWDLPKGHLEKNEKNRAAALREVEEECGIKNLKIERKLLKTYHTYLLKKRIILKPTKWYLMSYSGNGTPAPQEKEGITEVKWANSAEESQMIQNTFDSIIEVLKKGN